MRTWKFGKWRIFQRWSDVPVGSGFTDPNAARQRKISDARILRSGVSQSRSTQAYCVARVASNEPRNLGPVVVLRAAYFGDSEHDALVEFASKCGLADYYKLAA